MMEQRWAKKNRRSGVPIDAQRSGRFDAICPLLWSLERWLTSPVAQAVRTTWCSWMVSDSLVLQAVCSCGGAKFELITLDNQKNGLMSYFGLPAEATAHVCSAVVAGYLEVHEKLIRYLLQCSAPW